MDDQSSFVEFCMIYWDWLVCAADQDERNLSDLEELVWDANRAPPDHQIDQFMILARHVYLPTLPLLCLRLRLAYSVFFDVGLDHYVINYVVLGLFLQHQAKRSAGKNLSESESKRRPFFLPVVGYIVSMPSCDCVILLIWNFSCSRIALGYWH